jgi:hypothetical protein
VLAGFQDALDIAEQADTEGSQHDAARRLMAKLAAAPGGDLKQLPSASMNGETTAEPPARHAEAPARPADASAFDADLESRLNAAASQNGQQPPQEPRLTDRRPRGRPRKHRDEQP